jgi:RNA polymerase sigma factor (sigma-70 family)
MDMSKLKLHPDLKNASDTELISYIKNGETAPYELIMQRYNQRLYRVARSFGITDGDCDDLIQQSYINAYEKLDQFKGDSQFSTWLTRILINQCLMHKRRKKILITDDITDRPEELEMSLNQINNSPEKLLIQEELKKILEEAIEYLPEDYRIVYLMREVESMSVKETSETLDISESNVKIRLFRAKALLKNFLERYLKPDEIFEFGQNRCNTIVQKVMEYIIHNKRQPLKYI